jgi:hypothetical protein
MRQDDLVRTINQFLASPPFPACLLLVHPDPSRLVAAVDQLRDLYHWPDWRSGHELSAALLDVLAGDQSKETRLLQIFRVESRRFRSFFSSTILCHRQPKGNHQLKKTGGRTTGVSRDRC